jgi:hypothetical protein
MCRVLQHRGEAMLEIRSLILTVRELSPTFKNALTPYLM